MTTVHEYGWWEWQPAGIPPKLMEWLKQWGQDRGWWDREDGFLLTLSDAIITTNVDAETVLQARLPHLTQRMCRIAIAANINVAPIDPAIARQELRRTCHWSEDAIVIIFFGFLHPAKGLETLLPAFKQIVAAQPRARLLLAGGVESLALPSQQATHYWNKLGAIAAELGLSELVHLTGYIPAETASRYLTGSDIGVLPFNSGTTLKSGSLLAMLAHGLPVVATRSDPPDPALVDQNLLRLIASRDVNELATALIELLANPAAQAQLGQAGRAFAHNFTWRAIAKAHSEVYQNVLAHNLVTARVGE
jgi:glycosyltransferase involved in cell wall biosynthesis